MNKYTCLHVCYTQMCQLDTFELQNTGRYAQRRTKVYIVDEMR
jgi:hypothetical protein